MVKMNNMRTIYVEAGENHSTEYMNREGLMLYKDYPCLGLFDNYLLMIVNPDDGKIHFVPNDEGVKE